MLSAIRVSNEKNVKLADIHCQLIKVYGKHAITGGERGLNNIMMDQKSNVMTKQGLDGLLFQ